MKSITLYNKGKRTWGDLCNYKGEKVGCPPETSIEMEEAAGLRMIVDYPREFTSSKIAGPSSEDLARREQSLRDRAANLDAREKALEEREAALKALENEGKDEGEQDGPDDAKAELIKEAEALGLKIDGRMGVVKIKALIDEKKANPAKVEGSPPEIK